MPVIAEIYGKLSRTGSNMHDRLEDQLTGDVFGSLRYVRSQLWFEKIFSKTKFLDADSPLQKRALEIWQRAMQSPFSLDIRFWERLSDHGEIDLLIEGPNLTIGCEIKYISGLSSDDSVDNHIPDEAAMEREKLESVNQLARYGRYLGKDSNSVLILIAPADLGTAIVFDALQRGIMRAPLGLLTWQAVYKGIVEVQSNISNPNEAVLFEDLRLLLSHRGLSTFEGWPMQHRVSLDYYQYPQNLCNTTVTFPWPEQTVWGSTQYEFKH